MKRSWTLTSNGEFMSLRLEIIPPANYPQTLSLQPQGFERSLRVCGYIYRKQTRKLQKDTLPTGGGKHEDKRPANKT